MESMNWAVWQDCKLRGGCAIIALHEYIQKKKKSLLLPNICTVNYHQICCHLFIWKQIYALLFEMCNVLLHKSEHIWNSLQDDNHISW